MLLDHLAWSFVPIASPLGQVMHLGGRLTGPVMAFFVAEGYAHTRDVRRYLLRMGLFALISWPAYSLFSEGTLFAPAFGVIYTLFLGLTAIVLWDRAAWPVWAKVAATGGLCALSIFGDWPVFDVLWPLFLFLFRADSAKRWRAYLAVGVGILPMVFGQIPWWCGLFHLGIFPAALLLQFCYNGEGGSRAPFHKWFFYFFYPLHLLLLYALK